jgi:hypothetical protein
MGGEQLQKVEERSGTPWPPDDVTVAERNNARARFASSYGAAVKKARFSMAILPVGLDNGRHHLAHRLFEVVPLAERCTGVDKVAVRSHVRTISHPLKVELVGLRSDSVNRETGRVVHAEQRGCRVLGLHDVNQGGERHVRNTTIQTLLTLCNACRTEESAERTKEKRKRKRSACVSVCVSVWRGCKFHN